MNRRDAFKISLASVFGVMFSPESWATPVASYTAKRALSIEELMTQNMAREIQKEIDREMIERMVSIQKGFNNKV